VQIFYRNTIRRHNPEDLDLNLYRREILRSRTSLKVAHISKAYIKQIFRNYIQWR